MHSVNRAQVPGTVGVAAGAVLLLMATGNSAGLRAQSAPASSGIPQLSGILEQRGRGDIPSTDLVSSLNTRAKALIAAFDEFAAPKYDCVAATAPRVIDETLYNIRIEQLPDRVNFYYEKDDVMRTV